MQAKFDVSPSPCGEGEEGGNQVKISPNTDYIRTIPAIVKFIEFVRCFFYFLLCFDD